MTDHRPALGRARERTLDVTAETLSEAIAQALAGFRANDWSGENRPGTDDPPSRSVIPRSHPSSRMQNFESWLNR
jgi:hypothetical protein